MGNLQVRHCDPRQITHRDRCDALEIITAQDGLHGFVCLEINRASGLIINQSCAQQSCNTDLIENQNFGFAEECTSKADQLTLTGRQVWRSVRLLKHNRLTASTLGNLSVERTTHVVHNMLLQVGMLERLPDLGVGRYVNGINVAPVLSAKTSM